MNILTVDVGGSHVKVRCSTSADVRRAESGQSLTPDALVAMIRSLAEGWTWDRLSIGVPTIVKHDRIVAEPMHLGAGWTGFDFADAFQCPVRVINDAAMQALGTYNCGRMLFLGLGTALGSAFVVDGVVLPFELAHLPYRKARTYEHNHNAFLGGFRLWGAPVARRMS